MRYSPITAALALTLSLGLAAPAAAEWPASPAPDWTALVAAAAAEGPVVVMGEGNLGDGFIEKFKADTGLDAVFVTGGRSEGRVRFLKETEAGAPSVDVFIGGSSSIALAKKKLLLPIAEMLILPEVTDPAMWRTGALPYMDTAAKFLPVPSQYVSGRVLVNTQIVDPATLTSWDDLLDESLRGKIVFHDVSSSGAGKLLGTILAQSRGREFLDAFLNGQEVAFTEDYRKITDYVARGTYAIGLGAVPYDITRYQSEGLTHLQVLTMSDLPGYPLRQVSRKCRSPTDPAVGGVALASNER